MIGDAHHAAMVAAIDMAAKISSAAVYQVIDDFSMFRPQWVFVLIIVDMCGENIGYSQSVFMSLYDLGHRYCPFHLLVGCQ